MARQSLLAVTAKPDERVLIGPDVEIHVFRKRGRMDFRIRAPVDTVIRRDYTPPDTTYSDQD